MRSSLLALRASLENEVRYTEYNYGYQGKHDTLVSTAHVDDYIFCRRGYNSSSIC